MLTPLETYQDKAKQKARELTQDEDGILSIGKYDHEIIDTLIAQTITDLLDEMEETIGERFLGVGGDMEKFTAQGYNLCHKFVTKKINQIRE